MPSQWFQWFEENHVLTIVSYILSAAILAAIGWSTAFEGRDLQAYEIVLIAIIAVPAGFLFVFSLTGLISYFIFIPSISNDSHLFARVHATYLIHPLTTAIVLGLLALCIFFGSLAGLIIWVALMVIYSLQTAIIVGKICNEHLMNELGTDPGIFFSVLNLILGCEVMTVAAGAKPLPPWKLNTLPENTWIIDVRTKPEFHWNRLRAAENYPWGAGVIEAAANKPKDLPVLVTCFSGHRSPAVAVMLRRLGFKTVYNLNWGILYLILLERGRKNSGPFSLTRSQIEPNRRGPDYRGISVGYITCAVLTLIVAPLDNSIRQLHVSAAQQIVGAFLGLGGLLIGFLSFKALGRNFRVFAAPRRSGTLVTTGIYSKVRHPMYTGVVLSLLGYVVYFGSLLAAPFLIGCAILYVIKAKNEEPLLMQKYPEYSKYRERTWKFLPFVW